MSMWIFVNIINWPPNGCCFLCCEIVCENHVRSKPEMWSCCKLSFMWEKHEPDWKHRLFCYEIMWPYLATWAINELVRVNDVKLSIGILFLFSYFFIFWRICHLQMMCSSRNDLNFSHCFAFVLTWIRNITSYKWRLFLLVWLKTDKTYISINCYCCKYPTFFHLWIIELWRGWSLHAMSSNRWIDRILIRFNRFNWPMTKAMHY